MLELSGLRVTTFGSAEALLADGPTSDFDCLVLDIHLPGLSGPEYYGGLRARGEAPPAVFITAHDATETQEMLQRVGPAACLRKPFRGQQLLEAIRDAVGGTHAGAADARLSVTLESCPGDCRTASGSGFGQR